MESVFITLLVKKHAILYHIVYPFVIKQSLCIQTLNQPLKDSKCIIFVNCPENIINIIILSKN